jgi:hypothetical protein
MATTLGLLPAKISVASAWVAVHKAALALWAVRTKRAAKAPKRWVVLFIKNASPTAPVTANN